MKHLVCRHCRTEYDVRQVDTTGWDRIPHDVKCEVCRSVLKGWDSDHENIYIMTKHGAVATDQFRQLP